LVDVDPSLKSAVPIERFFLLPQVEVELFASGRYFVFRVIAGLSGIGADKRLYNISIP